MDVKYSKKNSVTKLQRQGGGDNTFNSANTKQTRHSTLHMCSYIVFLLKNVYVERSQICK